MAKEFSRARRVGEQLKRDIAQFIRSELDDPRLLLVSITSIDVSRDLSYATVFVTWIGARDERDAMVAILNQAAPLFRKLLGKTLHTRTVPRLSFEYDEIIERGAELSALIDQAVAADSARHETDIDIDIDIDDRDKPEPPPL